MYAAVLVTLAHSFILWAVCDSSRFSNAIVLWTWVSTCLCLSAFIIAPLIYQSATAHLKVAAALLFIINIVTAIIYADEYWCDVQPHLVAIVAALAVDYHR